MIIASLEGSAIKRVGAEWVSLEYNFARDSWIETGAPASETITTWNPVDRRAAAMEMGVRS